MSFEIYCTSGDCLDSGNTREVEHTIDGSNYTCHCGATMITEVDLEQSGEDDSYREQLLAKYPDIAHLFMSFDDDECPWE